MSITSDEVNYLVYRYLLEAGFAHSTFAFQHESAIHRAEIKSTSVPPGALITILQKGLQYLEVETHMQQNGAERRCIAPFTLLGPHECQIVASNDDDYDMRINTGSKKQRREDWAPTRKDRRDDRKANKRAENREKRIRRESSSIDVLTGTPAAPAADTRSSGRASRLNSMESDMDTDIPMIPASTEFKSSDARIFLGHQSEVYACSWHPTEKLLATGSGDGTVRVWDATAKKDGSPPAAPIVLVHSKPTDQDKDVTTLDWSPDGAWLATGSYDGLARIWTKTGEIKFIMRMHDGPIFALKWSKNGDLLLTASIDKTAIAWDANSGEARQQFQFHSDTILDVAWKDDSTFASCSTDKQIYICELGSFEPLRQFSGHKDEVNAIRWDPTNTYLASCSDDRTAKIWSLDQDEPVWDIQSHQKGIFTTQWGPAPSGGDADEKGRIYLATASFDGELRIWDFKTRTCIFTLPGHTDAIYSLVFSPTGAYLASGSFDHAVMVWSIKDGALIRTYRGLTGVYEVAWNNTGDRLAASHEDGRVAVFDVGNL